MAYLDVSPMIMALQNSPEQFCFSTGALHHIPSRHTFSFDRLGRATIHAQCNCSYYRAPKEQEKALFQAFNDWNSNYWRPLEVNREFARHFALPPWQRALISLTGRLHHAVLTLGRRRHEWVPAEARVE